MSHINIVLLGETGVGKTTFINALANYLTYDKLGDAKRRFVQLVPTTFVVTGPNLESAVVCTGSNENEDRRMGTQNPTMHELTFKGRSIRIVDTPGIGDSRSMVHDQQNANKLINFIGKLKHINAICIVLKPSDSRTNALFKFCIHNILSRLTRDVRDNVIFLFTHTRASSYTPGDTLLPLRHALTNLSLSETTLPFEKKNIFCVDNESFRFLAALSQGVQLNAENEDAYEMSWNKSATECERLLEYVMTLTPTPTQIIVTVRDLKSVISKLAEPLIEIMILHEKSMARIQTHKEDIEEHQNSIEELAPRLYIPVIQYKTTKKIITDHTSGHKVSVGGSVIQTLFGIEGKITHENMTITHSEELIEPYETKVEDPQIKSMLSSKQKKLETVKRVLGQLETMRAEYGEELEVIVEGAAKFVTFLRNNAIAFNEDPFQRRLEEVLMEERACGGSSTFITSLETSLLRYKTKKNNLSEVSSTDMKDIISRLLGLNHAGTQLRRCYNEILE